MTIPWTRRWAARVVEVERVRDGRRAKYSGHLVADGLALTAGHGLSAGDAVRVRPASGGDWSNGTVVWRGSKHDAALVAASGLVPPSTSLLWGELAGRDPVPASAYGFPSAGDHDLTPLHGLAFPDGSSRRGWLRVDVGGSIPRDVAGKPGWAGMSGAAVLDADGHLLGVIANVPADWRPDRLHAVPVAALLADPGFRDLVGDVETRMVGDEYSLLRPAYEELEWDADDVSISEPLKAKYAVVPFVPDGREDVLDELLAWCRDDRPLAVRSLTGMAGTGKSRLAAEACHRLGPEWHAGLAVDPATNAVAWGEWSPSRPTLIVIDYAEDPKWRDPFRRLFARLRQLRSDRQLAAAARILLVSRHPVFTALDDESGALSTMLKAEHNRGLTLPLLTPEIREAHVERAFAAFSARSNLTPVRPEGEFDSPLLIHVAALLGTMGVETTDLTGMELLDRLLARESLRWRDRLDVDHDDHAWQAISLATLTAPTVAEARDLLTAIPAWADRPFAARDAAAKALFRLYPGSPPSTETRKQRIAPVEPDLIAEHLLARTIDLQEILTSVQTHEKTTAAHHGRLLQIMDLTADHYPEVAEDYRHRRDESIRALLGGLAEEESLPELLAAHLGTLFEAVTARVETACDNGPANLLAGALEASNGNMKVVAAAADIAEPFEPDFRLARLHVTVLRQAIAHFQDLHVGGDRSAASHLAWMWARLATVLTVQGRGQDAVSTCVALFLFAANPPAVETRVLAEVMEAYSNALQLTGQYSHALIAAEEAVDLWRGIPDADVSLGRSLNILAESHNGIGQHDEALKAIDTALRVWRDVPAGPGSAGHRAQTLTQLAIAKFRQGDAVSAVAAAKHAVGHWREAASATPALERDLAYGLLLTTDLGADPVNARTAAAEAVEILTRLSAHDSEPLTTLLSFGRDRLAELSPAPNPPPKSPPPAAPPPAAAST